MEPTFGCTSSLGFGVGWTRRSHREDVGKRIGTGLERLTWWKQGWVVELQLITSQIGSRNSTRDSGSSDTNPEGSRSSFLVPPPLTVRDWTVIQGTYLIE